MPGYKLMELSNMQPHKPRGFAAAENVIGILDFLRELEEDPFSLPRLTKWQVTGVEEVLFAARPREDEVATAIHIRLNRAASDLEKRLLDIQVVFGGEIIRGADLTVKYRGTSLPIYLIFNHPRREEDTNGNAFYPMEFHLSSP
jgi:hypothetical protein